MKTTVTANVTHLCPHKDEVDHGTVTLTFDGEAPELHKLRAYLDGWTDTQITHESLCANIAEDYGCRVTGEFVTAGLLVSVVAP